MGRNRKSASVATGKIGKKKILDRKIAEEKLKIDREGLVAPIFLNNFAKEEFERVVLETAKVDLLDNLDLSILAIYCNAYSQYVEITKQIQNTKDACRYKDENRVSALINAQDKMINQIMRASAKLGLATTDRLKLIVPQAEDGDINKYLKVII